MPKFLKNAAGPGFAEEATVAAPHATPATYAGRVPELGADGVIVPGLLGASQTGGAPAAFKMAQLNASGRLDATQMPAGFAVDANVLTATEALPAASYVNIHPGGVRLADGSNGRMANGFVLEAVANGAQATVLEEGTNTGLSGLTKGPVYLSLTVPGDVQQTEPVGAGKTKQFLGSAVSDTAVNFNPAAPILLA